MNAHVHVCTVYWLVFSTKGAFLLSAFLFAFIPLLNRLAHSLRYTGFPSEVKNCTACTAEDRKTQTKGWAEGEEMKKNKESNEEDSEIKE